MEEGVEEEKSDVKAACAKTHFHSCIVTQFADTVCERRVKK